MALKEHENNIITKQYDDPITNYLRNIIQRYFQIENEISQESKEAIIVQAYTRLKEIINAYTSKYIICINERSGNIDLLIKDFGGEEAFDKNSAFNKDFCDVTSTTKTLWNGTEETYSNYGESQADHIVSGDDDRLTDARIPLMHIHTIDDVIGLREQLEEYNLLNGGSHLHTNENVLNMLIYAGSRTSIDLLLLEDLTGKVERTIEHLQDTNIYFINIVQSYLNQLHDIFDPVHRRLQAVNDSIDSWISNFPEDARNNSDIQSINFKQYVKTLLKDYLTNEEYQTLQNVLSHAIKIVETGTIPITNDQFVYDMSDSVRTKSERQSYHNTPFFVHYGYTNVALSCSCTKTITGNVLQKFANNNLNNGDINVFLSYTKDGVTYRDKLPHTYQVNESQHDFIQAFYYTDDTNKISVAFKRLSYLPVTIYSPMSLFAWVVDNTNQRNSSSLQIDSQQTSLISNNETQNAGPIKTNDSTTAQFTIVRRCASFTTQRVYDLQTVVAPYGAGGLGVGPLPDNPERTGAYKELLVFTIRDNYTGSFSLTMNTGHWYGFAIWESTDAINFTEMTNNYASTNATHSNSTPLTLTMNSVTFVSGHTYKIITQECAGGGTDADKFIYSFQADENFSVAIIQEVNVDVDVSFNAQKNNNSCNLSWTITKHYETAGVLIENDPPFVYDVIKNNRNNNPISCNHNTSYTDTGLDNSPPLRPKISGKCIASDDNSDTFEFTIEASDTDDYVSYKLRITADASDDKNSGVLYTTDNIDISTCSDIDSIHYNTSLNNFTDMTNDDNYTIMSDTDLNAHSKKVVIKHNHSLPIRDNKLYFCDNTYKDTYNNLQTYTSSFNVNLCTITNDNRDFINSIWLLQDAEQVMYHVGNGPTQYYDSNQLFDSNVDSEWYYIGEFPFGTLNDFFNNATIDYQLFTVPGKGENDA